MSLLLLLTIKRQSFKYLLWLVWTLTNHINCFHFRYHSFCPLFVQFLVLRKGSQTMSKTQYKYPISVHWTYPFVDKRNSPRKDHSLFFFRYCLSGKDFKVDGISTLLVLCLYEAGMGNKKKIVKDKIKKQKKKRKQKG